MNNGTKYIVVRNWDAYQHSDVLRTQSRAWVKLYTRLLHDDAFMELTEHRRYIFLMLLTHYALSHEEVTTNTARLSHVLATRVLTSDLEALVQAGFITLSARKPASKPAGKVRHRTEEKRKEKERPFVVDEGTTVEAEVKNGRGREPQILGAAGERYFAEVELMKLVKDANDGTWDLVSRLAARLPVSVLHSLRETLETRGDIDSPAGYVVSSLKAELEQRKVSA